MEVTAHREREPRLDYDDSMLIATALVIAFYVSAAVIFLQGYL